MNFLLTCLLVFAHAVGTWGQEYATPVPAETMATLTTAIPTEPPKPSDTPEISEPTGVLETTGTLADAPDTMPITDSTEKTDTTETTSPTEPPKPSDMPETSEPTGVLETTGTLADATAGDQEYPEWDSTKTYVEGDRVILDGKLYEAKWWSAAGVRPDKEYENEYDNSWKLVQDDYAPTETPTELATGEPSEVPTGLPTDTPSETPSPTTTGTPEYPEYAAGTSYKSGDRVVKDGKVYECKANVEAWCSGDAWAYEPAAGTAWESAWKMCADGDCSVEGEGEAAAPFNITLAEISSKATELTSGDMMQKVKDSIQTLPNAEVEEIVPGASSNPENVKTVEAIISDEKFEFLFPWRHDAYTYTGFLQAIGKFPGFCKTYSDERDSAAVCRKSLAVMFAHFAQETGGHDALSEIPEWRQALVHVREMGWTEDKPNGYAGECNPDTWQGKKWPCGKFPDGQWKSYFGRGAKQL
eukprot:Filipodium_phascolosomae@DN2793_c2_g1_i2.p1